ncbi:MAG: hypothetical protein Q7R96_01050 [Nanoarchaeota archaeon]|nr:hypothetical protein [Nanoarchaeota archaeon]
MVDRTIHWKKHLLALFITAVIFGIGIIIGIQLTDTRINTIKALNEHQQADFESLQLQYLYLNSQRGNQTCIALTKTLEENVYDLENARIKVENYLQNSDDKEELELIKRSYTLAEIRYWLLHEQTKQRCSSEAVALLYFYQQEPLCNDCSAQGYILTALKEQFKEKLLIFSIDENTEEPMVDILKKVYNISETPTLIIEEKSYPGIQTMEQLQPLLCKHYKNEEECP